MLLRLSVVHGVCHSMHLYMIQGCEMEAGQNECRKYFAHKNLGGGGQKAKGGGANAPPAFPPKCNPLINVCPGWGG